MMKDKDKELAQLKDLLLRDGYTCVLSDGTDIVTSRERGVRPLVGFIACGKDLRGYCAADRIVGKAAALLYAHMGIAALYADVLSDSGAAVLAAHGITVECGTRTERIINRKGDGICPMEQTVAQTNSPAAAYALISAKLANM